MIAVACMTVLALCLARWRLFHGAAALGSLALCIAALMVMLEAQYAVALWHRPFVDSVLASVDRGMGFDWVGYSRWLDRWPLLLMAVRSAYGVSFYLLFIFMIADALYRPARVCRVAVLVSVCGAATILMFGLWPALGPAFTEHAGGPWTQFTYDISIPAFAGVKAGGSEGLVFFPSFHSSAAALILYTVHGWGARSLAWRIAQAEAWLVAAGTFMAICPVGGHYLTDEIAGVLVVVAAHGLLVRVPRPVLKARMA